MDVTKCLFPSAYGDTMPPLAIGEKTHTMS